LQSKLPKNLLELWMQIARALKELSLGLARFDELLLRH